MAAKPARARANVRTERQPAPPQRQIATVTAGPKPRADAVRNRARVLAAALEAFREKGAAATTEDVARAAGVGVGTVFRHFPTKASLFEALVLERLEHLAEEAESLEEVMDDAGDGFFALLDLMISEGPTKRALAQALSAEGVDVKAKLVASGAPERVRRAVTSALTKAQRAGDVRKDVEVRDVYAIVAGAAATVEHLAGDAKAAARAQRIVLDGLRAGNRVR